MSTVAIEPSWKQLLDEEFNKPYFQQIKNTLIELKANGETIFPPGRLIFNAFNLTPVHEVKVVILGQDPYHNPGEAMGLSFSVPYGVKIPPSLRNIYKELNSDLGIAIPQHGDLTQWASQGVLLLNAFLTVSQNKPASHRDIGWINFTNAVINKLSEKKENIVFMLWGNFAKGKAELIDTQKHLVLTAAHPSPLAGGAFFGCKHFSKANNYLEQSGKDEIDWSIS
ncbi:MAG TPA: uracil-DNA glycosylase [Saprospiraceae bacterium]|nr:uracil-DNA glycosylase [Saprospiraceae bacterium]